MESSSVRKDEIFYEMITDWIIDWFEFLVNTFCVTFCPEVKESRSGYVNINSSMLFF